MSRARDLSKFVNPDAISIDTNFNVGVGSTSPDAKLDVIGIVSATTYFGDGSNLSGITANLAQGLTGSPDITVTNITGVAATFTGAIDANGTLDVDGHTELDTLNVSVATTSASLTLANAGVAVTAILDEDGLTSDRADALATQQSIKAYVDSQVTAQDLDFEGDSGTGAVDLDSQTFTIAGTANEIETVGSGITLTIGLPDRVTIGQDLTVSRHLSITGVSTFTGNIDANGTLDVDGQTDLDDLVVSGVSTFSSAVDINSTLDVDGQTDLDDLVVAGVSTFSGPLNIDDTTQSTSTSTGALIVDGGVGIAKSLFVGGDLSIGGTVTYEDVTNVDSIGIITARSGIHIGSPGVAATLTADGGAVFTGIITGNGSGISGLTNSNLSGSAGITNANLANSTISGVSLGSNLNSLSLGVSGTGLSGSGSYNGSSGVTFTVTSDATNANTASAIVARDASGNFSAGTITASLSGTATNATNINVADESTDTECFPVFTTAATGNQAAKTGTNLTFNSSTGQLTATSFSGDGSSLTNLPAGTSISVSDESSDTECFPVFTTAATGNQSAKTGSNLTFNSSNGTLTATTFSGSLATSDLSGTITNAQLAGSIANDKLVNSTISGTSLGSDLPTATFATSGTGLSGSATYNGTGTATFTVTSNATNANTASAIVARDASGNFSAGTITATLSGNCSGSSGSCTGNSSTATALQTSRNINGVSFNGSANITVNPTSGAFSNGQGARTVQSGGSASGGSSGDIYYIY